MKCLPLPKENHSASHQHHTKLLLRVVTEIRTVAKVAVSPEIAPNPNCSQGQKNHQNASHGRILSFSSTHHDSLSYRLESLYQTSKPDPPSQDVPNIQYSGLALCASRVARPSRRRSSPGAGPRSSAGRRRFCVCRRVAGRANGIVIAISRNSNSSAFNLRQIPTTSHADAKWAPTSPVAQLA